MEGRKGKCIGCSKVFEIERRETANPKTGTDAERPKALVLDSLQAASFEQLRPLRALSQNDSATARIPIQPARAKTSNSNPVKPTHVQRDVAPTSIRSSPAPSTSPSHHNDWFGEASIPSYTAPQAVNNPYAYQGSVPTSSKKRPLHAIDSRLELRSIAIALRLLNLAILAYLMYIPVAIIILNVLGDSPLAGIMVFLTYVPVAIFNAYAVYRLAAVLRGKWIAIIHTIGSIIGLGLIILLVNNYQATWILKRNGIRVGLLGADPNSI